MIFDDVVKGIKAIKDASSGAEVATNLLGKALQAIKAHPIIAIISALSIAGTIIYKVHDALTTTTEEAKELYSEFKDVETELKSLNEELKDQEDALQSLLDKSGELTYTEKGELERLQQITAELRIQQGILERKKELAQRDAASSAVDAYNDEYGYANVDEVQRRINSLSQNNIAKNHYRTGAFDNNIDDSLAAYSVLSKDLDDINKKLADAGNLSKEDIISLQDEGERLQGIIQGAESNIVTFLDNLSSQQVSMADEYNNIISKMENGVTLSIEDKEIVNTYETIDDIIKLIYSYYDSNTWNNMAFDKIFATDGLEITKDEFLELAKTSEVLWLELTKFPKLCEAINNSDIIPEDGQTKIQSFTEQAQALGESLEIVVDKVNSISFNSEEFNEEIQKYEDEYGKLMDVQEEWNEFQAISADTYVELQESGLLEYIEFTSEGLKVNTEKLLENAQACKDKAVADLRAAMTSDLLAIATGKTSELSETAKSVIEQLGDNAETAGDQALESAADWATLGVTISNVMKEAGVEGVSTDQEEQMNALYDFYSKWAEDIGKIDINVPSRKSSSKSSKDTKETFDWIETAISRVQRTITNLGKVVSATYRNWSKRNNALAQEMSAINQEIATQQNAYDEYMRKANSVNLSDYYKNLVQNGGMDISTITDETLAENIKLYKDYYEKALDAADAVEDLRANLAELAMTKFDNLSKQYDNLISLIEHRTSMLEGYISQSEAAGFWASEVYYQKLADTELENINKLQAEYNDLIAQFNENVNSGNIEKYSEDWYNMYQQINDVEKALQDANTALIEYNQTLQQSRWDLFDRGSDYKNNLTEEANFLIDMLDNYDLYNDDGSLTEHGLAVQGLHAVNYNVYMEQAASYADEIQKINEEIANDPNDLQLIDRRNELLDLQQQAIQNAMSEKEAIKDLVADGYDKMLDSLQELIDKRKEALNAEKDLYNYQNSIKEKTDTISNYRKQIQSYASDNSEEAKATIQKLQLSLEKAEQDLRETEYDKWLSDQESLLDNLYDQTEAWINGRLDEINGLVSQTIETTNANASSIKTTIDTVASSLGVTLSDTMDTIWGSEEKALGDVQNVVKEYGDILYGTQGTINTSITNGTTTVQNALKDIDNDILKMIEILNTEAKVNAESIAQQQQQAESSQDDHNDYDWSPSPEPEQTSQSNKVTLGGGLFYEDSYKGGNTGNSVSQWTGREVEVTHTSSTGMVHIVDAETGTVLGWVDPDQLKGYATGTTNARRGFNMVSEAGDEIVLDNRGNAVLAKGKQLYPFEGGETVIKASETANILKNGLVPLSEQAFLNGLIMKPNYSAMQSLQRASGSVSNDIKMNITLPNVTDYDSFVTQLKSDKRFEKIVQSMTIDRALNKNSLSKNKL